MSNSGAIVGGVAGPIGPAGPEGPRGPQGIQGITGAIGPAGPTGPEGSVGATGLAGPIGPIGPEGAAGPAGVSGPEGAKGATGSTGLGILGLATIPTAPAEGVVASGATGTPSKRVFAVNGNGITKAFSLEHGLKTEALMASVQEGISGKPGKIINILSLAELKPTSLESLEVNFVVAPVKGIVYFFTIIA